MSLAQSMNLDSVMAHLGKMSPQQLQQFASMHKDDPIMLAAASSVKNRMDKIAQSQQAQTSGQKPPPVNEQVVQSMGQQGMPPQGMPPHGGPQASNQLPEQQGIGALPTPNMQHMAGGGIVAFADGGYTDDQMMDDSSPVKFMADGGVAHFQTGGQSVMRNPAGGGVLGDLPGAYVPGAVVPSQYVPDDSELTLYERAKRSLIQSNQEAEARRQGYKSLAEKEAVLGTNKNARDMLLERPQTPMVAAPSINPATAAAAAAAKTGAATTGAGNATTGATQPRPQPQGGIATLAPENLRKQYESFLPKETTDRFAQQQENANAAQTNVRQEYLNQLREDQAAAGIAGEAKEKRIGKREGDLEKQKDLNLNLSLMEAGFATMQSRGKGLAGIGEGATAGLKTYGSGIQRLQAAREKIDDARDQLDDLRRNEANMNRRELRGATNELNQTIASGQDKVLAGLRAQFGADSAQAMDFAKMTQQSKENALNRATQEKIASMPNGQMQLLSSLGNGDTKKGLEIMTAIQAGKTTPAQMWEKYITAFAGKDQTVSPPMTPQQFMAQYNQVLTLSQVPKAGNAPTGKAFD
jgi:hypothetical protein